MEHQGYFNYKLELGTPGGNVELGYLIENLNTYSGRTFFIWVLNTLCYFDSVNLVDDERSEGAVFRSHFLKYILRMMGAVFFKDNTSPMAKWIYSLKLSSFIETSKSSHGPEWEQNIVRFVSREYFKISDGNNLCYVDLLRLFVDAWIQDRYTCTSIFMAGHTYLKGVENSIKELLDVQQSGLQQHPDYPRPRVPTTY